MKKLSPSQAAQLTGVTVVLQRDWRRRGLMRGAAEGHNAFDAGGLSELFIMGTFARAGRLADGPKFAGALGPVLGHYLEAVVAGRPIAPPNDVAVLWANGEIGAYPDAQIAFDQATEDQQAGPVTVIDLSVLATPWAIKVRDQVGV